MNITECNAEDGKIKCTNNKTKDIIYGDQGKLKLSDIYKIPGIGFSSARKMEKVPIGKTNRLKFIFKKNGKNAIGIKCDIDPAFENSKCGNYTINNKDLLNVFNSINDNYFDIPRKELELLTRHVICKFNSNKLSCYDKNNSNIPVYEKNIDIPLNFGDDYHENMKLLEGLYKSLYSNNTYHQTTFKNKEGNSYNINCNTRNRRCNGYNYKKRPDLFIRMLNITEDTPTILKDASDKEIMNYIMAGNIQCDLDNDMISCSSNDKKSNFNIPQGSPEFTKSMISKIVGTGADRQNIIFKKNNDTININCKFGKETICNNVKIDPVKIYGILSNINDSNFEDLKNKDPKELINILGKNEIMCNFADDNMNCHSKHNPSKTIFERKYNELKKDDEMLTFLFTALVGGDSSFSFGNKDHSYNIKCNQKTKKCNGINVDDKFFFKMLHVDQLTPTILKDASDKEIMEYIMGDNIICELGDDKMKCSNMVKKDIEIDQGSGEFYKLMKNMIGRSSSPNFIFKKDNEFINIRCNKDGCNDVAINGADMIHALKNINGDNFNTIKDKSPSDQVKYLEKNNLVCNFDDDKMSCHSYHYPNKIVIEKKHNEILSEQKIVEFLENNYSFSKKMDFIFKNNDGKYVIKCDTKKAMCGGVKVNDSFLTKMFNVAGDTPSILKNSSDREIIKYILAEKIKCNLDDNMIECSFGDGKTNGKNAQGSTEFTQSISKILSSINYPDVKFAFKKNDDTINVDCEFGKDGAKCNDTNINIIDFFSIIKNINDNNFDDLKSKDPKELIKILEQNELVCNLNDDGLSCHNKHNPKQPIFEKKYNEPIDMEKLKFVEMYIVGENSSITFKNNKHSYNIKCDAVNEKCNGVKTDKDIIYKMFNVNNDTPTILKDASDEEIIKYISQNNITCNLNDDMIQCSPNIGKELLEEKNHASLDASDIQKIKSNLNNYVDREGNINFVFIKDKQNVNISCKHDKDKLICNGIEVDKNIFYDKMLKNINKNTFDKLKNMDERNKIDFIIKNFIKCELNKDDTIKCVNPNNLDDIYLNKEQGNINEDDIKRIREILDDDTNILNILLKKQNANIDIECTNKDGKMECNNVEIQDSDLVKLFNNINNDNFESIQTRKKKENIVSEIIKENIKCEINNDDFIKCVDINNPKKVYLDTEQGNIEHKDILDMYNKMGETSSSINIKKKDTEIDINCSKKGDNITCNDVTVDESQFLKIFNDVNNENAEILKTKKNEDLVRHIVQNKITCDIHKDNTIKCFDSGNSKKIYINKEHNIIKYEDIPEIENIIQKKNTEINILFKNVETKSEVNVDCKKKNGELKCNNVDMNEGEFIKIFNNINKNNIESLKGTEKSEDIINHIMKEKVVCNVDKDMIKCFNSNNREDIILENKHGLVTADDIINVKNYTDKIGNLDIIFKNNNSANDINIKCVNKDDKFMCNDIDVNDKLINIFNKINSKNYDSIYKKDDKERIKYMLLKEVAGGVEPKKKKTDGGIWARFMSLIGFD